MSVHFTSSFHLPPPLTWHVDSTSSFVRENVNDEEKVPKEWNPLLKEKLIYFEFSEVHKKPN